MEDKRVWYERLPMFNNLWELKLKFTHLFGKDMGFEFDFVQLGYLVFNIAVFGGIYFALWKIKLLSILTKIPAVGILFSPLVFVLGYPIALSFYLNKIKLDGKVPYKYIMDYAEFLLEPNEYQNWIPVKREDLDIKVAVPFRKVKIQNSFSELDKKEQTKMTYDYD